MKTKLFSFLAALDSEPIAQAAAIEYVATIMGTKPRLVKAQAKAAKATKAAAQTNATTDPDTAIEGILFFPPDLYYTKSGVRNEYEPRRVRDIILKLTELGLSKIKVPGEKLSEIERAVLEIQEKHSVCYAGPQTAHRVGLHSNGDCPFLVTREPKFLVPCKGAPGLFMKLIDDLCGVGQDPQGEIQKLILLGWFQQWLLALYNPDTFIQGQILALGGPPGIGKTRFAYFMAILGGDRANEPGKNTNFNSDLLSSTLEVSHDDSFPQNSAGIREYWLKRKALVSNSDHRIEKKYHDARTMPLAAVRCMMSFNPSDEGSKVVPPMVLEEGMGDKVIFIRAYGPQTPYPQQGTPEGKAWVASVQNSLPAFIWYEQNEFVLPDEFRESRYGVTTYHHPEIVALIHRNDPDWLIGEAINRYFERHSGNSVTAPGVTVTVTTPLEGTITDVYIMLRDEMVGALREICTGPRHLLHQLARIKEKAGWGHRITEYVLWIGDGHEYSKRWKILPPGPSS